MVDQGGIAVDQSPGIAGDQRDQFPWVVTFLGSNLRDNMVTHSLWKKVTFSVLIETEKCMF